MGLFRLLVTGAAVAAGVHYITKKRPDGTSIADDLKAKAPEWMEKAKPYINQVKEQFAKTTDKNSTTQSNNYSNPDPAAGIGTL